jgi:ectoine hydroxylase-related dioxygenase (phytanoyl-CoA dioxygenase family)
VRGGRVEWHQDYTYTGYLDPPSSLSVRLALSECSLATGCLQVLDGSHRWGRSPPTRALTEERVVDLLPPEFGARIAESTRALEIEPGDLTLHHCMTWHCSVENLSERPRKTIIAHLFDADSRLVRERLPADAAQFSTDAEGRLCGEAFPLLYDEN